MLCFPSPTQPHNTAAGLSLAASQGTSLHKVGFRKKPLRGKSPLEARYSAGILTLYAEVYPLFIVAPLLVLTLTIKLFL